MKRDNYLGRRSFYRMKATYLISYRARFSNGTFGNYNYTLTKDISAGGILIMSEEKFAKGTQIEMIIQLPMYPDKNLRAVGEVTSSFAETDKKPLYPIRVRFIGFDEVAFGKLKSFIEEEMNKVQGGKTLKEKLDRRKE